MKEFSLKFIDIMIGVVLGLGFQWWPNLQESWQYLAFAFAYVDIIDYWIDYSPSLKKFPPKRELDLILDVAIMFSLFLYIYAAQTTIWYLFAAFIAFRAADALWLLRARHEHQPTHLDKVFLDTWLQFDLIEITVALGLIGASSWLKFAPIGILIAFIVFRVAMRVLASFRYKKVYFT